MCCRTCCCCIDLRAGVKALGLILALWSLLSLIFAVVQVENQRQDWLECAAKAKDLSSAENEIKCDSNAAATAVFSSIQEIAIKRGDDQAKYPSQFTTFRL